MKQLLPKQAKFVALYLAYGESRRAAIEAGYSVKSADQAAYQLLRHPLVIKEIENHKIKKASEIKKEDFVEMALKDYKDLEVTEPNKPRNLELAGRFMGFIGAEKGNITNNTQININAPVQFNEISDGEKLNKLRDLLE